jgi:hypothetical protein
MIATATRETVKRSQIHKAAYNPRKITEATGKCRSRMSRKSLALDFETSVFILVALCLYVQIAYFCLRRSFSRHLR